VYAIDRLGVIRVQLQLMFQQEIDVQIHPIDLLRQVGPGDLSLLKWREDNLSRPGGWTSEVGFP
jgi:hypothetical protein